MKSYSHIISTNRADLGLLYNLIVLLESDKLISSKVIFAGEITGEKEYIKKYFPVKNKEFIGKKLLYSNIHNLAKQANKIAIAYSKYLSKTKRPDYIICLGDRYELLSLLQIATLNRIPIIHIHGGDKTYGALDNEVRYAISKLAKLHCPVTKLSKKNLISAGEEAWRIQVVGSPGRDILKQYVNTIERNILYDKYNIKGDRFAFVAYHPETYINKKNSIADTIIHPLIEEGLYPVVSRPNPDPFGDIIRKELQSLHDINKITLLNESIGPKYMCSIMEQAEIMIGNSSSGILEASLFNLPVINIGSRQSGREIDNNVFSLDDNIVSIKKILSKFAGKKIKVAKSIYEYGNVTKNIYNHISKNVNKLSKSKN